MKEFVFIKNSQGFLGIGNYDKKLDAYCFMNWGYLSEQDFKERNFEYTFLSRELMESFLHNVKCKSCEVQIGTIAVIKDNIGMK